MANIFLKDPVYITIQEIKDSTTKTNLQNETDDNIKILINKAQQRIDKYIKKYWIPEVSTQETIFPTQKDWIPEDIKIATFYTVEQIYENWDTIHWAIQTWSGVVKSEKTWDRSITYDVWTTTTWYTYKLLWLPLEAINLLKKYKWTFIPTKI